MMSGPRVLQTPFRVRLMHRTPTTTALTWTRLFATTRPSFAAASASQTLIGQTLRQSWRATRLFRDIRFLRFKSTKPSTNSLNPTPHLGSPEPSLTLSQRMRKLSREYGWTVVGVYGLLSVADFPLCYLAVKLLGTERIGRYEHAVIEALWSVVHIPFPDFYPRKEVEPHMSEEGPAQVTAREGGEVGRAVVSKVEATIWTTLALAYAVHKSLIFIRVPLTAALTPKVVKTLRGWGWDIGKRKPKPT